MPDIEVRAPLAGVVVPLTQVPDEVFATAMMGPGVAIVPSGEREVAAISPVGGVVSALHPHAFVITAEDGRSVLVHLGIDTVQLGGAGFTQHVRQGDAVAAGDAVVTWSPSAVVAGGMSAIVPVVALAATGVAVTAREGTVEAGDPLLSWSQQRA